METPSIIQDPNLSDQLSVSNGNDWSKKLPLLLRTIGAIAVMLSLYSFLVRGWEGSSDLIRYFILLGHTGLLGCIGLASGHYLKEGKGARLLMMLALVSVPVNFAILGALLLSALAPADLVDYPHYVAWTVESVGAAGMASVIALVILAPLSYIGFRSLARGMSRQLTVLFLLSNIALLMPLRDPVLVSAMAVGLTMYILYVTTMTARQKSEARTSEGVFALLLQFLPVAFLLGRNIWLYAPEATLMTAASATGFLALRQIHPFIQAGSGWRTPVDAMSLFLALGTGFSLALALAGNGIGESLSLVTGTLVAAALTWEASIRVTYGAAFCRGIAIGIAAIGLVLNLVLFGGIAASILTLGLGVAGIFTSYTLQQRSILAGSVVLVVAGLVDQYLNIFHLFNLGSWATLALIGMMAIVLASLLESKGIRIRQSISRWRTAYSDWSY